MAKIVKDYEKRVSKEQKTKIVGLARDSFTPKEISGVTGISSPTILALINDYIREHPEERAELIMARNIRMHSLTREQSLAIRELAARREDVIEIADITGISVATIRRVLRQYHSMNGGATNSTFNIADSMRENSDSFRRARRMTE